MEPTAHSVSAEAVRDQLARIVASRGFAASPRLQRFLSHIVEQALSGHTSTLKEYTIALEPSGYVPQKVCRTICSGRGGSV